MSMQQMLAWQPTNPADANQEFEAAVGLSMRGRKRKMWILMVYKLIILMVFNVREKRHWFSGL